MRNINAPKANAFGAFLHSAQHHARFDSRSFEPGGIYLRGNYNCTKVS